MGFIGVSWGRLTSNELCGRLLQLDPVAQRLPSGSSAYPLDQRHLSHRVEGGWLILQQSLRKTGPQS
jgi:hypothetical protein